MSRPKKKVTRSEIVRVKMTKEEKEDLRKQAAMSGMSMSELIRWDIEHCDLYTHLYMAKVKED